MPRRKESRSPLPRSMRCNHSSHLPVMTGLFTSGWTTRMRPMPFSVAPKDLPLRTGCPGSRSVSRMAARVAGVPSPDSRIASASSLSSSRRPADSIAVSRLASVSRGGGRVRFVTGFTSRTARASPFTSPGGRSCSSSGTSASPSPSFFALPVWVRGAFSPPPSPAPRAPESLHQSGRKILLVLGHLGLALALLLRLARLGPGRLLPPPHVQDLPPLALHHGARALEAVHRVQRGDGGGG